MNQQKIQYTKILVILIVILFCGYFLYAKIPVYEVKNSIVSAKPIPDFSKIDDLASTDVISLIPAMKEGVVEIGQLRRSQYFDLMGVPIAPHVLGQGQEFPVGLEIKSGVYKLSDLADGTNIEMAQEGWIIHIPVIVHPEATLVIDEGSVPVWLDTQKAAFISNFGQLFVVGSTVRSTPTGQKHLWKETEYRPFMTAWGGSKTYFSGSRFYDLGYDHAKSYGITFSAGRTESGVRGVILDNRFERLYYGFYSDKAEDIVIARNIYRDNIIYGIDPHDYSKNLIIAYNDVSGTQKKHGIILSRGVSDSIIFRNKSYNNSGSGIMLERGSTKNIVAENSISDNQGDGLVFLESSDNLSFRNLMERNERSGIRVRNSEAVHFAGDKSFNNGDYGFMAYPRTLSEQIARNLEKDSYKTALSFTMRDCILSGNKKAAMNVKDADESGFSHITMLGSPQTVTGEFNAYSIDIQGDGITLLRKTYADLLKR